MPDTDIVAHRHGYTLAAPGHLFGRFRTRLRPLLVAAGKAWIAHRNARLLVAMSEHQLKDIGVRRTDIGRAVRHGRL